MSWLTDILSGTAGNFVKDVGDTVKQFVTTDKDRLELEQALQKIQLDYNTKVMEIGVQYEQLAAKNAEDINKTMQSEANAEHWPTYAWRPYVGFIFGTMLFGVYFVLPILHGYNEKIVIPVVPESAWVALGAVLGVASWFRGKMQADPTIPTVNRG